MGIGIAEGIGAHPVAQQAAMADMAWLIAAAERDSAACFELGVAHSTGARNRPADLIDAHMWFNLAAAAGHEDAAECRADVAEQMSAREIAEAQRRARHWLASVRRRAA
jgi:TPR repeat protein